MAVITHRRVSESMEPRKWLVNIVTGILFVGILTMCSLLSMQIIKMGVRDAIIEARASVDD